MILRTTTATIVLLAALILAGSCGGDVPSEVPDPTPPPTPELTEFERELLYMKTADFDHIYIFKRKDGGKLTDEDKDFIRERRHHATNRSSVSEDETVVFIGSNFAFEEENLEALKERFEFEDHSKPPEQIKREQEEANANSSGNSSNSSNSGENR